jgi:dihydroorotase-like cyclic amidohydrolase
MPTDVRKAQAEGFRIHAILTSSEDAAQALARADRVGDPIKVEVPASAPAGRVVAR